MASKTKSGIVKVETATCNCGDPIYKNLAGYWVHELADTPFCTKFCASPVAQPSPVAGQTEPAICSYCRRPHYNMEDSAACRNAQLNEPQDYWRCFHCDFYTRDRAEAEAHFGKRDDAEEFKPVCKWWAQMDDTERKHAFQDVIQQLNEANESAASPSPQDMQSGPAENSSAYNDGIEAAAAFIEGMESVESTGWFATKLRQLKRNAAWADKGGR